MLFRSADTDRNAYKVANALIKAGNFLSAIEITTKSLASERVSSQEKSYLYYAKAKAERLQAKQELAQGSITASQFQEKIDAARQTINEGMKVNRIPLLQVSILSEKADIVFLQNRRGPAFALIAQAEKIEIANEYVKSKLLYTKAKMMYKCYRPGSENTKPLRDCVETVNQALQLSGGAELGHKLDILKVTAARLLRDMVPAADYEVEREGVKRPAPSDRVVDSSAAAAAVEPDSTVEDDTPVRETKRVRRSSDTDIPFEYLPIKKRILLMYQMEQQGKDQ